MLTHAPSGPRGPVLEECSYTASQTVARRYTLNTEGNSLWAGLAFLLNKQEVLDEIDENGEFKYKDIPHIGPVLGYRIVLNESLDFSMGGGYGVYPSADAGAELMGLSLEEETAGSLLDFSLGYSF